MRSLIEAVTEDDLVKAVTEGDLSFVKAHVDLLKNKTAFEELMPLAASAKNANWDAVMLRCFFCLEMFKVKDISKPIMRFYIQINASAYTEIMRLIIPSAAYMKPLDRQFLPLLILINAVRSNNSGVLKYTLKLENILGPFIKVDPAALKYAWKDKNLRGLQVLIKHSLKSTVDPVAKCVKILEDIISINTTEELDLGELLKPEVIVVRDIMREVGIKYRPVSLSILSIARFLRPNLIGDFKEKIDIWYHAYNLQDSVRLFLKDISERLALIPGNTINPLKLYKAYSPSNSEINFFDYGNSLLGRVPLGVIQLFLDEVKLAFPNYDTKHLLSAIFIAQAINIEKWDDRASEVIDILQACLDLGVDINCRLITIKRTFITNQTIISFLLSKGIDTNYDILTKWEQDNAIAAYKESFLKAIISGDLEEIEAKFNQNINPELCINELIKTKEPLEPAVMDSLLDLLPPKNNPAFPRHCRAQQLLNCAISNENTAWIKHLTGCLQANDKGDVFARCIRSNPFKAVKTFLEAIDPIDRRAFLKAQCWRTRLTLQEPSISILSHINDDSHSNSTYYAHCILIIIPMCATHLIMHKWVLQDLGMKRFNFAVFAAEIILTLATTPLHLEDKMQYTP